MKRAGRRQPTGEPLGADAPRLAAAGEESPVKNGEPATAPKPPDGLPSPPVAHADGFTPSVAAAVDDPTERRVDEIDMIGEELAVGLRPPARSEVTAGMRYLHSSRTIHQLVADRNRAVGIYLAVASLMWTASATILNAKPAAPLIVPIESIQRWCLPTTAATLTVLSLFTGFLLIRTRIGLIYEVAKMNALLGLPVGRVKRVNPLSIFFILHLLVSIAGGASGTFFVYHLLKYHNPDGAGHLLPATLTGLAVVVGLVVLYVVAVVQTTADSKLLSAARS
jgi:hypothetical protein